MSLAIALLLGMAAIPLASGRPAAAAAQNLPPQVTPPLRGWRARCAPREVSGEPNRVPVCVGARVHGARAPQRVHPPVLRLHLQLTPRQVHPSGAASPNLWSVVSAVRRLPDSRGRRADGGALRVTNGRPVRPRCALLPTRPVVFPLNLACPPMPFSTATGVYNFKKDLDGQADLITHGIKPRAIFTHPDCSLGRHYTTP